MQYLATIFIILSPYVIESYVNRFINLSIRNDKGENIRLKSIITSITALTYIILSVLLFASLAKYIPVFFILALYVGSFISLNRGLRIKIEKSKLKLMKYKNFELHYKIKNILNSFNILLDHLSEKKIESDILVQLSNDISVIIKEYQ